MVPGREHQRPSRRFRHPRGAAAWLQVKGSAAGRCELQGFRGYALEM